MRVFLLFIILFFNKNLSSFDLYDLDFRDDYLNSGKKLMNLGFGLHDLEPKSKTKEILIGIHGADSRGFEWIYPLQKIDNEKINTYFFRWDTSRCAKESIEGFLSAIKDIGSLDKIIIIGHSYGGVFSSLLLDKIQGVETEIHVIAAPVGNNDLEKYCKYTHPQSKNENITYFQWRTIKELDNAFNSFDYDPQIIDFAESSVVRLPSEYNGRRLGHLWSISWVADNFNQ